MQEVDHQRLRTACDQRLDGGAKCLLIEQHKHAPSGIDALRHLNATLARDQRLKRPDHAVGRRPDATTELECVAETLRRHEPAGGTLALENSIDANRGAMDECDGLGRIEASLV